MHSLQLYIDIRIKILDINYPFHLYKHNMSNTGFSLCLQIETTPLGPVNTANHFLRTYWTQLSWFHLKAGEELNLRNALF
jgi:hypothetical protein